MNYSVEAEGIDFILRFRDEASGKINIAEKGYTKLVSAMQNLINVQRTLSDTILETVNTAGAAMKSNTSPIVTPFTITQDQVNVMGQFEAQAVSWFRNLATPINTYIGRARRAVSVTNDLGAAIDTVIQSIKKLGENLEGVDKLGEKLNNVQGSAQKSAFHVKDLTQSVHDAGEESTKSTTKLTGLLGVLDKIGKAKYAVTGIIGGVLYGQGVAKYASVEDAAYAIRQSIGETSGTVEQLTNRLRDLSLSSGFSATTVAGAFTLIAQRAGRVTSATNQLALLSVEFSKLTQTSAEAAGELTGTLVGAFGLSEQAAGEFLKMANLARQSSRGLTGPEFIQAMTQNVDQIKKLSMTMGQTSDEFLRRNASSMMAIQKEFSMIYGDVAQVQDAMKGAVSIVGEDASKIRKLLVGSGTYYEEFRDKIRQGRLDEAFVQLAEAWQKRINQVPEQNRAVFRRMFAEAQGFSEDQLAQLERLDVRRLRQTRADLENTKKVNDAWNKGVSEWRDTFSGLLEQLHATWSFFQSALSPALKLVLFVVRDFNSILIGGHKIFGSFFDGLIGLISMLGGGLLINAGIGNVVKLSRAMRGLAVAESEVAGAGFLKRLGALGFVLSGIEYSIHAIIADWKDFSSHKDQDIDRSKGVMGMKGRHATGFAPLDWLDTFIRGPEYYYKSKPGASGPVTPAPHQTVPLPPMTVTTGPASYNDTNQTNALLQQVAATGDNTSVVNELRRISSMIDLALSKMTMQREPLAPKYGKIALGEI